MVANEENEIIIALDIGGTKLMVASCTLAGKIIHRERAETPKELQKGLDLINTLIGQVAGDKTIIAIGASAGGPLDFRSGVVSPLHMPTWREVKLKEIFEAKYKCPFSVDVDTNAAALAEHLFSPDKVSRLLYVTISTGMGGGFVVDGDLYRGANGSHPEIGHQAIPFVVKGITSVECPCGASGCLEALVSGTAIRKIYGKAAEELTKGEWAEVSLNIAVGLRNAAILYSPDEIVLGGGMALGGGVPMMEIINSYMRDNLKLVPVPGLRLSTLGYDTALMGAYALARKNLKIS